VTAVIVLGAWLAFESGQLSAQEEDTGRRLEEAAQLAREERFDDAIGIWLGLLDRLEGSVLAVTHKKLGVALQQTGRLPEAWYFLSLYLASGDGTGDETAAGWMEELQEGLTETHVKVTFSCSPEDLVVRIPASFPSTGAKSKIENRKSEFSFWFLPGRHELFAEAPGYRPQTIVVVADRARGDGVQEIRLAALVPGRAAEETGPVGTLPDSSIFSKPSQPEEVSRTLEWVLLGSGVALGVTGAVFYGMASSRNDELHDQYKDEANYSPGQNAKALYDAAFDDEVYPKEVTAYVLCGAGIAALGAGIATWLSRSPEPGSGASATVAVAPLLLPAATGAMLSMPW